MGIFKAYDIRGVYPGELNETLSHLIGKAVADFLDVKTLVVSRDMRVSSDALAEALNKGITEQGVDCIDIGLVSTPANYFGIANYGYPGGVMTTASHNPPQYNGFKISREQAIPLSYETGIGAIEKLVKEKKFRKVGSTGTVTTRDIQADYTRHVLSFAKDVKPLKIVVDVGNGMGGKMLPPILEALGLEVTPLYFELDGRFPNHEANPLKEENLKDVKAKVLEVGADLGVAVDGDADRATFIDERGETVPPDLVTALLAREVLTRERGATIIYEPRSSWAVREEIERLGGKSAICRVGHAYMKAALREKGAALAGELSGHYYFRDNFCADSAAIAMVLMLNLLSAEAQPFSAIVKPLRRYYHTGEINFQVEDKDARLEEIARAFSDGSISHVDGVTVEYPDWWFNVRKSNTEPLVRLTLEAKTPELRDKGKAKLMAHLGRPVT